MTESRGVVNERQFRLVERIRKFVPAAIADVEVVGDPVNRLPHLVSFSCLYVEGEALVSDLDRHGFSVASGSACTASTLTPSHVLEAMGALTHGNIRISLTRTSTAAEVDRLLDVLPGLVTALTTPPREPTCRRGAECEDTNYLGEDTALDGVAHFVGRRLR